MAIKLQFEIKLFYLFNVSISHFWHGQPKFSTVKSAFFLIIVLQSVASSLKENVIRKEENIPVKYLHYPLEMYLFGYSLK